LKTQLLKFTNRNVVKELSLTFKIAGSSLWLGLICWPAKKMHLSYNSRPDSVVSLYYLIDSKKNETFLLFIILLYFSCGDKIGH